MDVTVYLYADDGGTGYSFADPSRALPTARVLRTYHLAVPAGSVLAGHLLSVPGHARPIPARTARLWAGLGHGGVVAVREAG